MNAHVFRASVLVVATALLSGCIAVGGTDNYTKPTMGKQLMDLKTARDYGRDHQ